MARNVDTGFLAVASKRYWREADARCVIEAWRGSGEPLSRFAERLGLKPRRLEFWARRLGEHAAVAIPFHLARLADPCLVRRPGTGGEPLEIVLLDGRRVRVPLLFEPEHLRRLLAVLESFPC